MCTECPENYTESFEDTNSTNSKTEISYVKMLFNDSVLSKGFWILETLQRRALSDSTQIWTCSAKGIVCVCLL
jgi:hypothetical protein